MGSPTGVVSANVMIAVARPPVIQPHMAPDPAAILSSFVTVLPLVLFTRSVTSNDDWDNQTNPFSLVERPLPLSGSTAQ